MKRARFAEKQTIGILKVAEAAGNGRAACREHNITEQTSCRWRRKYSGLEVSEARKSGSSPGNPQSSSCMRAMPGEP